MWSNVSPTRNYLNDLSCKQCSVWAYHNFIRQASGVVFKLLALLKHNWGKSWFMTVFSLHKGCVRPTAIRSRRLLLIMYSTSHKMLQTSVVEHSLQTISCWIMSYFSIIYEIKLIQAITFFIGPWFQRFRNLHVTQNVANFQSTDCMSC